MRGWRAISNVADMTTHPLHVLVAGGGVAALETMMALRSLAGDGVEITLLAPDRDFRYRPMAVAEPFTIEHLRHVALAEVAAEFGARVVTGALAAVDPAERRVETRGGVPIGYDALVIACGTRVRPAFEGALTIDDRRLGETLRGLVRDVEQGYTHEVAFVAPAQAFWPLPLYELALLTAQRAYDMNATVEISIVSPESAPLALFGSTISNELSRLLHDAGIRFHGSSFAELDGGELTLAPSGRVLRPARVVALPLLEGTRIPGVPADAHGFIPVSDLGEVHGLDGVYAAGDVTAYPIKHGGLAAQQADVVASAIAARAGLAIAPQPLMPVLRGVLMTGGAPLYLEAELGDGGGFSSSVSDVCPWDPPAKIVARHLGPYLAREDRHAVRA
ncbi:MAG: sulfide:quinone oxidoreductase [Solirubrobacteraceae bacterium]|nr:sulfide:quinone oxidoreductase [Solirubrobacteraceae bacterium]